MSSPPPVSGLCKLCGTLSDLRRSHIIPELCYLSTYDTKHRAIRLEAADKTRLLIQKGIREPLLCDACEGRFSKWEGKFKQYWYGVPALPKSVLTTTQDVVGFDYSAFKLFHISILWRMGVATIRDFDTVDLGSYEPEIRRMLLAEDPGGEDKFPFVGKVVLDVNSAVVYAFVSKPQTAVLPGHDLIYVVYAGVEWSFILADKPNTSFARDMSPGSPTRAGKMTLGAVSFAECNTVRLLLEQRADQMKPPTA